MDYYAIGQRIRQARKMRGLSQESLAETVQISVTHMSHIETGNTKLSLAVLVDIATALDVSTDTLLFGDQAKDKALVDEKIQALLGRCTPDQSKILADIIVAAKKSLDMHIKNTPNR